MSERPWIPVTLALPPSNLFVRVRGASGPRFAEAVRALDANGDECWWLDEKMPSGEIYLMPLIWVPTHWRLLKETKTLIVKMKE